MNINEKPERFETSEFYRLLEGVAERLKILKKMVSSGNIPRKSQINDALWEFRKMLYYFVAFKAKGIDTDDGKGLMLDTEVTVCKIVNDVQRMIEHLDYMIEAVNEKEVSSKERRERFIEESISLLKGFPDIFAKDSPEQIMIKSKIE